MPTGLIRAWEVEDEGVGGKVRGKGDIDFVEIGGYKLAATLCSEGREGEKERTTGLGKWRSVAEVELGRRGTSGWGGGVLSLCIMGLRGGKRSKRGP